MNVRKTIMGAALSLLLLGGLVEAGPVSWVDSKNAPREWTIVPASPTPADVITFSGPTREYDNSCAGESSLGGTPETEVDVVSKTILLSFRGPRPQQCPAIYAPVAGLQGDFGPLEAGDWTFKCLARDAAFELRFTVGGPTAYRVDADAPGRIHDGTTWEQAFLTLQDALAVAGEGDEILVAEGTYKPDQGTGVTAGDREASFTLPEGVTVRGGFAGYGEPDPDARDIVNHETVLSGDLNGDDLWGILNTSDNSYHVVTGPAGEPAARLDGFTITHGRGDGAYPHHNGGGLYNPGGKLEVVNCSVRGNTAVWGGGAMNLGGTLTLVNCQLTGNWAMMLGGGLYNYEGSTALHNCRIVGNTATYAETAGGAAIYNLNAILTLLDCTVADNLSPRGRAIASFCWAPPLRTMIEVTNSILYNGGDELWSNDPGLARITYSDVQGGATGDGNLNVDPQFVTPGVRSIEGEWIDGDYRLQATSAAIDAGDNAALPMDVLDLDGDGDAAEPLPLDLDNEARVEGSAVDMGAYEQAEKKTPPPSGLTLTVCSFGTCVPLTPDPGDPTRFTSDAKYYISDLEFKAKVTVTVVPTSPAGGTWTGAMIPDVIGPGDLIITEVVVTGEGLNLAALPPGSTTVQAAEVQISFAPAP